MNMKLLIIGQFDLKVENSCGSTFWSLILCIFDLLFLLKQQLKVPCVCRKNSRYFSIWYKRQLLAWSPPPLLYHPPLLPPLSQSKIRIKLQLNLLILNCLIFLSKPSHFLCLCLKCFLSLNITLPFTSDSYSHP